MLLTVVESTAGSPLNTDLLSGSFVSNAGTVRVIRRAGLVGSAAIRDASVDLYIGSTFIARLFNTTAGANIVPVDAKDMMNISTNLAAAPFEPIRALISDAGVTNALVLTIDVAEIG